jgi:hypothetical protein
MLRRLTALTLIFAMIGLNPWVHMAPAEQSFAQSITAQRIPLRPDQRRVGRAHIDELWDLQSANSRFGGFSGMTLLGPRRFLFGSDSGQFASLRLSTNGDVSGAWIAPLHSGTDARGRKSARDMEGMTAAPDGTIWASYEGRNEIRRFSPGLAEPTGYARPSAMRYWRSNSGPESIARLADGRFLLIAENRHQGLGGFQAVLFPGDPVAAPRAAPLTFVLADSGWGRATDATALPNGRVLILHRRLLWSGDFQSALSIGDLATMRPGRQWRSRLVALFPGSLIGENFEGMVVAPADASMRPDQVTLWLIADDNLARWQRTLLMRLTIDLPPR